LCSIFSLFLNLKVLRIDHFYILLKMSIHRFAKHNSHKKTLQIQAKKDHKAYFPEIRLKTGYLSTRQGSNQ